MKPGFTLTTIALTLLLAACANTAPAPTRSVSNAATSTADTLPTQRPPASSTSELDAQATPVTLADDVLVVYRKHGGIAGIDETLVVHHGGLLELTSRGGKKSVQADGPMIQPLRRMFEQKDFGELEPLYQAAGADLFVYTVTARDTNGKIKTVTTMDAAKTPSYLGVILSMLNQLRAQVK